MKTWPEFLRREAGAQAAELGLPGPKHEGWRLIDASPLHGREPAAAQAPAALPEIDAYVLADSCRIVFVDGVYAASRSSLPEDGTVKVCPLGLEDDALHACFGQSLAGEFYAQLNLQHFTDCAFVQVKGAATRPIHVLHVAGASAATCYARCLVVVEANASATLVEEYAGDASAFVNAVTEVVIEDHGALRHVRVQSDAGLHVGNTDVKMAGGAQYDATSLSFGGRLSRHYLHLAHAGEGSDARLEGLSLSDGRQVADAHSRVDHLVPNAKTVQRHKCIADGASTAVFSGNIVVHRGAKGTDTKQENRNLLLSGRAKIEAQPQLEILNDDVSCKHGSTVGQLDPEELFYLKSRGLGEEMSRKLLIYAFAAEIVDRVPVALASRLRDAMLGRLA